MKPPTCLDLFCGCGGFSLGLERAGFRTLAAVDVDPAAITTFQCNFPHVTHALQRDLTVFAPSDFVKQTGITRVNLIVGGPPCHGFPTARVPGGNHGKNPGDDPRRELYRYFYRFLEFFRPELFVLENVPGILTAGRGVYFERIMRSGQALNYRLRIAVLHAGRYGIPQKRIRVFFFGTRQDLPPFDIPRFLPPTHEIPSPGKTKFTDWFPEPFWGDVPRPEPLITLGEAIDDLPPLAAGEGAEEMDYDLERRRIHLERHGSWYLEQVLEVHRTPKLTSHVARRHNAWDLRDFARLLEGETSAAAMRRGVVFERPGMKWRFKYGYTRQSRNDLCSSIVAHLSRDGLMYIHPTQNRSLTPREAARVQSFPDWFRFPVAHIHRFRLIGNAVPPRLAWVIGRGLLDYGRHHGLEFTSTP